MDSSFNELAFGGAVGVLAVKFLSPFAGSCHRLVIPTTIQSCRWYDEAGGAKEMLYEKISLWGGWDGSSWGRDRSSWFFVNCIIDCVVGSLGEFIVPYQV